MMLEETLTYGETRSATEVKIDAAVMRRVKRGMALLEERHGPTWVDHIDLATLDLAKTNACVLGQVYAGSAREISEQTGEDLDGYDIGARVLFGDEDELIAHHGFETTSVLDDYGDLQEAWEQVLTPLVHRR